MKWLVTRGRYSIWWHHLWTTLHAFCTKNFTIFLFSLYLFVFLIRLHNMWSRISFCILYIAFRGVHYLNHKKEGKTWNLMYKRHGELFTDNVIKLNTALQWLVISKSSYFLIPCPILFKFTLIFFKYLKLYNKSNLVWRFWFPLIFLF